MNIIIAYRVIHLHSGSKRVVHGRSTTHDGLCRPQIVSRNARPQIRRSRPRLSVFTSSVYLAYDNSSITAFDDGLSTISLFCIVIEGSDEADVLVQSYLNAGSGSYISQAVDGTSNSQLISSPLSFQKTKYSAI